MECIIHNIVGYRITYKPQNGSYEMPKSLRRELESIGGLMIRTEHREERPELCITLPEDLESRVRGIKGIVKMEKCHDYDLQLF